MKTYRYSIGVLGFLSRLLSVSTTVSALSIRFSPLKASGSNDELHSLMSDMTSSTNANAKEAMQPRVVVVGAGIGGLAVASRIAAETQAEVIVLEKNAFGGGRCGSFEVDTREGTFRHERGPSLLLLKDKYEEIFQDCAGKAAKDYGLEMKQCLPAYQVVFEDGDCLDLGFPTEAVQNDMHLKQLEQSSRRKMDSYEANGSLKWDQYMKATSAFLDCGLPNFIEEKFDLMSFPAFLREALRDRGKAWPLKPHSDVLDSIFESGKIRALASFQDLYVGLDPYRNNNEIFGGILTKTAPAVFGLLAAIELHPRNRLAGVYAPIGGFRSVTHALQSLAEDCGVKCFHEATVQRIADDGVVVRTHDGAKFLPADLIVINADFPYATKSLLNEDLDAEGSDDRYDWDGRWDLSSGVIAFHWSIRGELTDLRTHNVFLAAAGGRETAERSWRVLRSSRQSESDANRGNEVEPFNFYVHRPSHTDPSASPKGGDSLLILVPCETLEYNAEFSKLPRSQAATMYREQQFNETRIGNVRSAVLRRLAILPSLHDIESRIVDEMVDHPASYADLYNVAGGAPFGLSHGLRQLSISRPGAESSKQQNVLFVGASCRPGNGVPLVLIGAKLAAQKAIKKLTTKLFLAPK